MLAMPCLMFGQESAMQKIINKYSNKEGYTSVYISKFMFDMLRNADIDMENDEVEGILKNLNSIIILTKEGPADEDFNKEMKTLMNKENYQELMRVKEDDQEINFMARMSEQTVEVDDNGKLTTKDNQRIKEFVMMVNAPEDPTLIYINGDITPEQLSNLSKTMNIDGLDMLDAL